MSDDIEEIRFITYMDEGDVWHAQCLEFDVAVQALDLERLIDRLILTFELDMKMMHELKSNIDIAPKVFFKIWKDSSDKFKFRFNKTTGKVSR